MLLPFLVPIFLIFSGVSSILERMQWKKFALVLSVAVLVLLSASRGNTRDTENYIDVYNASASISGGFAEIYLESGMEPGFVYFARMVHCTGLSASWFLFIVSSITTLLMCYSFFRLSPYPIGSICIYFSHLFLHQQLMQIRAGLAYALLFSALTLLFDERRKMRLWGAAVVGLACLIHSMVFIVVPFLISMRWCARRRRWPYLVLIGIVSFPLSDLALRGLINGASVSFLSDRISDYSTSDTYGYDLKFFDPTNVRNIIIVIGLIRWLPIAGRNSSYWEKLAWLFCSGAAWRLIFHSNAIIAARGSSIFSSLDTILVPLLAFFIWRGKFPIRASLVIYGYALMLFTGNMLGPLSTGFGEA